MSRWQYNRIIGLCPDRGTGRGKDAVMILDRGTKLGPYGILELLGVGGMGEFYRTLDTRPLHTCDELCRRVPAGGK